MTEHWRCDKPLLEPTTMTQRMYALSWALSSRRDLTNLPLDKMAAISQMTLSNAFSSMENKLYFDSNFNLWFREMVARETFNQSRRSIPIAAEDSVTAAMRSDKLRHTWLCRHYSSWNQLLKTLSTHRSDFVFCSSLINLPVLINPQRRGSRRCFCCWMCTSFKWCEHPPAEICKVHP